MARSLGLALWLVAACGCSCAEGHTDGECVSSGSLTLDPVPPARLSVTPGADVRLSAILVRQCVGVVPATPVHFEVIGFGDHTIPEPDVLTDEQGIAQTIVEVGAAEGSFQVQAVAQGSEPIAFTIDVALRPLILRVVTPEPIVAAVSSRVSVTYKLQSADAQGELPVAGEEVLFSFDLGPASGATLDEEALRTGPTGTVTATIRTGPKPTTLELRGEAFGTSPAVATIVVEDGIDAGCRRSADCPDGFECRRAREEPLGECAPAPGRDNPADCDDANPCDRDFECRDGRCLEPDFDGEVCEFDDECQDGQLCISGLCTVDPRSPPACTQDADCGRLACRNEQCVCEEIGDCPVGWDCAQGDCVQRPDAGGGDGCVADHECPDDQICERGDCLPRDDCRDPDLSGSWTFDSRLHLRQALGGWLADILDAIEGPLRFLSEGILDGFDFDVPVIGDALEDAANGLVDQYVPDWVGELLGAIADISDVLETWEVRQEIDLFSVGGNEYRGEEEWTRVSFELGGDNVAGTPEEILGWDAQVEDFAARTTCGTLNIDEHDVGISVGSIVRWLLDVSVTIASEGEYFSLEDLLYDISDSICYELALALQDLMGAIGDGLDLDLPDLQSEFEDYCIETADEHIERALGELENLEVELGVVEIAGQGTIVDRSTIDEGVWQGELLGGDFDGVFTAQRR